MLTNIPIRNPELLDILEGMRSLFMEKYSPEDTNRLIGSFEDTAEDWVGEDYRKEIMAQGREHIGYPIRARSYALKPEHYLEKNSEAYSQYKADFREFDEAIKVELGIAQNALSQLYPPQGFISWHNNADAPGYNLIFTWSETGDGWFKYVDEEGKVNTIYDTKGWTLKAGYFGTYDDNDVCYHAAYTSCWRMTHSFVVSKDKDFWLDCIEHIKGE